MGAVRQNMLRKREVCLAYVSGTVAEGQVGMEVRVNSQ